MKCIECDHELSQEEINANMCWECGHIIDETLADKNELSEQEKVDLDEYLSDFELFKKEHKDAFDNFLMTTGYNFEGYTIKEYKGIVHAECALGTGIISEISLAFSDLLGTSSGAIESKISNAKGWVEDSLKIKAIKKDSNAIIGIDYDIMNLTNNMIIVSGNATAVKIEKNK